MASSQRSQVTVTTNDGVNIHVDRQVAERSVLIKNLLEDVPETGESIQLPNVNEAIMRKVIKWCEHHRNDLAEPEEDDSHMPKTSTDIDEWDRKFMQVDQETLFQIILVANYLDIKALLDLGNKTVEDMTKGKSPEEIRKTFNIEDDSNLQE
ncbi:hypothetical protein H2201_008596 [Coniosporium apollinis]|uniref:E3 ubiquitin ligase complex SCF subunit n=2 Tax=Coniosporium TaxID=2810619 RepID=A0ABQ9NII4_9PEZI|nr:hypothetical protein H2199_009172 [Cladosporium sp. JES 115]KAJ9656264.1 hypothetical protein H2201_008596 [Coniosporium apollinis]